MATRANPSWLLLAACCLAIVPAARAQVDDRANLFTAEAVKNANDRLGQLKARLGKGLVLDTFKEVPEAEAKKHNLDNANERDKFFAEWARQRIRETKLDGVHVLICLAPHRVEVTATPGVEDRFSPWSQQHLRRFLKSSVRPRPSKPATKKEEDKTDWQHENDGALRDTVTYVKGKVTADRGVGRVVDEAHLFKPETIGKADRQIKQLRQRFAKDLTIATVSAAPEIDTEAYNLKDAGQKKEFLDDWVRDRASRLDGIYVLVCLDPKVIHVFVSEGAPFTDLNKRQLYRLLVDRIQPDNPDQGAVQEIFNKFRKKRDNDAGLLAAVDLVEAKLDWNRPVDLSNWMLGLGAMGGLLGVWIFLGVVRIRLRRTTPADAGVHDADDSGRSIAVLGGGIGAVCGEWLFGHVLSAGRSVARVVVPPPVEDHTGDSGTRLRLEDLQKDSLRHDVNNGES
ncbi:MAG: TPM domain-containing protein [Planctomycetes bacterium]|nr:TPM domain-containing protein [Planctomycetota bacterium]